MDDLSRSRYANCLKVAGMTVAAVKSGFACEGARLDVGSSECHLALKGDSRTRWLKDVLLGREPAGLRGYLVSVDPKIAEKIAEDISTVVLAEREALVLGDPIGLCGANEKGSTASGALLACHRCFTPVVSGFERALCYELPRTAARLLGGNWADVVYVALTLFDRGEVGLQDLSKSSALTGLALVKGG